MLNFSKRSTQKELLDGTNIPYEDVILNMKELDAINTYLGGHTITKQGFKNLLGDKKAITVLEIGCGGGDNLRVLYNYCQQRNIAIELWGIDTNFDIITFAVNNNKFAHFICSDYRLVNLITKPDIIFSSLFCHHFSNEELTEQLIWMKENSNTGFFINDLHRHWLAYYSIKILTLLLSKSYLVKNDAPLSVARGFRKKEWHAIFANAKIATISMNWKWAFRHLIICKNE